MTGGAKSVGRSVARAVQRVYDEANAFAARAGGVEYGMNILLGPPIEEPDLMIISLQGGGADRTVQRTWPKRLLYSDPVLDVDPATGRENRFGRILRQDFQTASLTEVLLTRTTASNIIFPQWPDYAGWRRDGKQVGEWERMSLDWLSRLLSVLKPKLIATYGKQPFEKLTGSVKRLGVLSESEVEGIRVLGCGHLSRGATSEERSQCASMIRRILHSG